MPARLPSGVPLDVLQELVKASESGNFGGYNALAWHKGYTPNAMERPRDQYGFPQWQGSSATGLGSHGAGAYQFEPKLWGEFAPGLGVKDFSPESQDRVFAAAVDRYGITPWKTNRPLQAAIRNYQQTRQMPQSLVTPPAGYLPSGSMTAALDTLQPHLGEMPPPPDPQMASLPEEDPTRRYNLGFGGMGSYY
jgi:muramidase (phage lysozyme)